MLNQILYTNKDHYKMNAVLAFSNRLVGILEALPELNSFDAFFRLIDNVNWMPCLVDATNDFKEFIDTLAREYPEYIEGTAEMFDEPFKTNCRVYKYANNDWDFVDGFPNGNPENKRNALVFGPFADIKHTGTIVARDHFGSEAAPGRRLQVNGLHRVPVMRRFIAWDNQRSGEAKKATVKTKNCSNNSGRKTGKVFNQAFQAETSATGSSLSVGALESPSSTPSPETSRATPELYAQTSSTDTDESTEDEESSYPNSCVIICHDETSDEYEESNEESNEESYEESNEDRLDNSELCSDSDLWSDSDDDSDSEYSGVGFRTLEYFRKHDMKIRIQIGDLSVRYKLSAPTLTDERTMKLSLEGSYLDALDNNDSTSESYEMGSRTIESLRKYGFGPDDTY